MRRRSVYMFGGLLAVASLAAVAGPVPRALHEEPGAGAEQREERGPRVVKRVEIRHLGGAGGYLGVTLDEVDREAVARLKLAGERGARVRTVREDSPASRAGLKADDVVLEYHGERVLSAAQFERLVRETPPGRKVELTVARDGGEQRLSVEIGRHESPEGEYPGPRFHFRVPPPGHAPEEGADELPDLSALRELMPFAGPPPRRLGLSYHEITGQLARYFKLAAERGVLVAEVDDGGPAARAGVKAGDVIVGLGGRAIEDGSDLREVLAETEAGQQVTLKVWRDGRPLDLKVTLGGGERARLRGAAQAARE